MLDPLTTLNMLGSLLTWGTNPVSLSMLNRRVMFMPSDCYVITFQQVSSVDLLHPHLTKSLATKLSDSLQSLPVFHEATITNPQSVVQLPHLTCIHRLTIVGISSKCLDWEWMRDARHLRVLELHIDDTNVESTKKVNDSSELLVSDQRTTISINGPHATELVGKVLEYLPTHLSEDVSTCLFKHTVQSVD